jgi:hypothetical protein
MAQENIGALTIHLIDGFELKAFILGCRKHPNGASATELEMQLISNLVSWGLEKIFISIITDTASNMNSLGAIILSWNEESLLRHYYCADHVLQLKVATGFFRRCSWTRSR